MVVKVDGVDVTGVLSVGDTIEDYTATTADITVADHPELFTTGTHNVVVYNAADVITPNANKASVLNTTYTVTPDTTAPYVESVTAVASRTFKVKVSEELSVHPTITVKKGTHTFASRDILMALDPKDDTNKTYLVSIKKDADLADTNNKLYTDGENQVSLSVNIKDYKDNATLLGAPTDKTVTLAKDTATPKVLSDDANTIDDSVLKVKFDGKIENNSIDTTKITVRNKDGVKLTGTITAASTNTEVVSISLKNPDVAPAYASKDEPYTVEFAKGAVKYYEDVTKAETFNVNTNANEALTTKVSSLNNVAPVTVKGVDIINNAVAKDGVLKINYADDMDASAIDLNNYKLDGAQLPAGTKIEFVGGIQKVNIIFPAGRFTINESAKLTISTNVKTKTGSRIVANALTKAPVEEIVKFTDNTKPVLTSGEFLVAKDGDTKTKKIRLTFSENMKGSNFKKDDFKITVNGNPITPNTIADATDDKYTTLEFSDDVVIASGQPVVVKVVPKEEQTVKVMDSTDIAGNELTEGTTITITSSSLDVEGIKEAAAQEQRDKAEAAKIDAQIEALPAVSALNLTNDAAVTAAKGAYDGLTPAQKAFVKSANVTHVNEAASAMTKMKTAEAAPAINSVVATTTTGSTKFTGLTDGVEYEYVLDSNANLAADAAAWSTAKTFTATGTDKDEIAAAGNTYFHIRVKATANKVASGVKDGSIAVK